MINGQIRELAEQAKGFVDLNQHVGGDNGCMVYTYEGLENFAKVIVQECVNTVKRVGILEDIENETDMVVNALKEKFGIEE